ncbi:lipid-binding protein [Rhodotorula kratochvilovae]
MTETTQPTSTRSSLSSLLSRATDRLPPVSALPHLARQSAARVDPRQHSETLALQLTIKALSGCVQDRVALAREEQVFAKQLWQWSKDDEGADVVDMCDRLAWLAFKSSELEQDAARKVEESRAVLKDIRNMENDLVPRRRNEKQLAARIATLEKEAAASKKADNKHSEQLAKLRAEHAQLEAENATFEASFAVLKRQKLHEAFALQFAAQKELGEKLALVAGYGELLLQGMETQGVGNEYTGKDRSAQVKVELEEALARWTPSAAPKLQEQAKDSASLLSRSDTRSFGETHAPQLSQLDAQNASSFSPPSHPAPASHHIVHPPPLATLHSEAVLDTSSRALPPVPPHLHQSSNIPPPLPARGPSPSAVQGINLSPTSPILPSSSPSRAVPVAVDLPPPGADANPGLAPAEPTVAETGAPIVGTGGPASGQLRPRRRSEASSVSSAGGGAAGRMPGTFNAGSWGGGTPPPAAAMGAAPQSAEGEQLPAYGEGDDEAARARDQAEAILAQERDAKAGGAAGGFA